MEAPPARSSGPRKDEDLADEEPVGEMGIVALGGRPGGVDEVRRRGCSRYCGCSDEEEVEVAAAQHGGLQDVDDGKVSRVVGVVEEQRLSSSSSGAALVGATGGSVAKPMRLR